ncbi:lytic murein transglycosylase [Tateyamaria sp. SN6-1]|uniref:lytic murein transglycosylase n=1 Tax=Tateyamaria sp. SN6-1 TaxID=3092148 RepID=UPI0039F602EA
MRCQVLIGAVALTVGSVVSAGVVTQSLRPEARPAAEDVTRTAPLSLLPVTAGSVLRPQMRPVAQAPIVDAAANARFQNWIQAFRGRAVSQGISAATFDQAFRGVQYDPDVIKRDRNQSEFTKTIWEYLASAVSDSRIRDGKEALRAHNQKLDAIEARYGVEKEVVVAVWGLESRYGAYRGNNDVIQSLATLAFDGRRGAFFEGQLVAALKILQNGDTSPRNMTGSWAGAMGHTQFIPTSYLDYAVDFTGDGKRDIWSDDPTDALASTAAYLKRFGWIKGQPWGVEVLLPDGFDFAQANRKIQKSPAEWARLGVRGVDGNAVPNYGSGSILLPAGGRGVAFMVFKNFAVIERYNAADAYVIGVGHLSDRIKGGGAFVGNWPEGERPLTLRERKELQQRLTRAGYDTQGVDGKVGPNTLAAVRAYQKSIGVPADGFATVNLLNRLR